ncbi:hypothetical protein HDR66_03360 [bacterium]|nr:hypothetical protein [bacterium]
MNGKQRYLLYLKMIKQGPTISVLNDISDHNFVRIDWSFTDADKTYHVRSYKLNYANHSGTNLYSTDIFFGKKRIAIIDDDKMAKTLFNVANRALVNPIATCHTNER